MLYSYKDLIKHTYIYTNVHMYVNRAIDTGINMLRLQTRACATYSKYLSAESVHMHNAYIYSARKVDRMRSRMVFLRTRVRI